jgi:hypothetical protein
MVLLPKPHKQGFRPITVTSTVSRIFDAAVARAMAGAAERSGLLETTTRQAGAIPGRRTTDIMLSLLREAKQVQGTTTLAVATDVAGGFNNLRADLVEKEIARRWPGKAPFFRSFLADLKAVIESQLGRSGPLALPRGAPQSSPPVPDPMGRFHTAVKALSTAGIKTGRVIAIQE